jgi:prepilin-type N-terminal cleavage/methylation domain-containing protein
MMQDLAIKKKRRGFTLVELIVAIAVFLVIISISFSTLSRFFAMRSAQEQEMILQQNFRFALDKMAYDFRQANKNPGDTSITSLILEPGTNSMGEKLSFVRYDGTDTTDIYYLIKAHGDSFALYREEYTHGATQGVDDPLFTPQPVTEDMHQLVKVYFVCSGGKIIAIVVGKLDYFGKERTISFTSLVFSRNSGYEIPPPSSP